MRPIGDHTHRLGGHDGKIDGLTPCDCRRGHQHAEARGNVGILSWPDDILNVFIVHAAKTAAPRCCADPQLFGVLYNYIQCILKAAIMNMICLYKRKFFHSPASFF